MSNGFWLIVYALIALGLLYVVGFAAVTLFDFVEMWNWLHPSRFNGAPI